MQRVNKLKVCFFGSYDKNYSKNVVLFKGLKKNGVKITECFHTNYFSVWHYTSLLRQYLKKGKDSQIIYVAFFGHYDVLFAWVLAKLFGKKLVFDPLISIYNTRIEDRKYFKKSSLRAKLYILLDSLNVRLADKVFLDTKVHSDYFIDRFGLSRTKIAIVRVGAYEGHLKPKQITSDSNTLKCLFYGSYQPSQGVLKIAQTANILRKEDIEWTFIGSGQDRPKVENFAKKNRLKKIEFVEPMPFSSLVEQINSADLLFGVFGNTTKTKMVIHNKIYQSIAMGKALITQDTPAIREILDNEKNVILAKPTPTDIAKKTMQIHKDRKNLNRIAKNARKTYLANFTSKSIGKRASDAFLSTLKN